MNSTKKTSPKKSAKSRIPKGLPGAGQYASKEKIEIIRAVEREKRQRAARERKNAKLREKRKATRTARKSTLAKATELVSRSQLNKKLKGWGSTSTSRLRAGTKYHWHAVMVVSGNSEALGKIAALAGSERVKLREMSDSGTPAADKKFEAVYTPYLGSFTPADAYQYGPEIAESMADQYRAMGAQVEVQGMFYNKHGDS